MIGRLPKSLRINDVDYPIRTDYRIVLNIFEAYNEPDYPDDVKQQIAIECLLEHPEQLRESDVVECLDRIDWYIAGGEIAEQQGIKDNSKTMDWEQDEQLIFSAVNKVAGKEVREVDYMHWWTFLGYFKERGECLLNTVMNIRDKINHKKKLTDDERDFYKRNKSMIDIIERRTAEEIEIDKQYEDILKKYGC